LKSELKNQAWSLQIRLTVAHTYIADDGAVFAVEEGRTGQKTAPSIEMILDQFAHFGFEQGCKAFRLTVRSLRLHTSIPCTIALLYGKTHYGAYMKESEAVRQGFRPERK
jgi:hypothetical protein